MHVGVPSLPALDVTSPTGSSTLNARRLGEGHRRHQPLLSHPAAPGDIGRGRDDHNIEKAQPKQMEDL